MFLLQKGCPVLFLLIDDDVPIIMINNIIFVKYCYIIIKKDRTVKHVVKCSFSVMFCFMNCSGSF